MSEGIREPAEECVQLIYDSFADFPWDEPEAYADWLAQTHYYVRHATRVLALAAARCDLDDEILHRNFIKGIREEQGHEELVLRDLRYLGHELQDFPELPETAAYYQTLYHAIDHDGPVALFGYFLPLEGLAALKMGRYLEGVRALYSDEAANFLRVHCELDMDHFEERLKALSVLRLPELETFERSLRSSTALYIRMVNRLKAGRRRPL